MRYFEGVGIVVDIEVEESNCIGLPLLLNVKIIYFYLFLLIAPTHYNNTTKQDFPDYTTQIFLLPKVSKNVIFCR